MRERQEYVIKEIAEAYKSGYKHILLEAPTGFGKSAVAATAGLTLGSCYICTSTKDLQAQYHNDFPFIKTVKGKRNFTCHVKQDYINIGKYQCKTCEKFSLEECQHTSVDYGPCLTDGSFKGQRCGYRTFAKAYEVINQGTVNEIVAIKSDSLATYKKTFHDSTYRKYLSSQKNSQQPPEWQPCGYFDQLNIGLRASQTILNYPAFLSLRAAQKLIEPREVMILDECHSLEQEVVKYKGMSISKKRWKRYFPNFTLPDHGYDLDKWAMFLAELEEKLFDATGQTRVLSHIRLLRGLKQEQSSAAEIKDDEASRSEAASSSEGEDNADDDPYGLRKYYHRKQQPAKKMASSPADRKRRISELEQKILEESNFLADDSPTRLSEEILVEAISDRERLTNGLDSLLANKGNWIVNEVKKDGSEITRVELKPVDVAPYCGELFSFCPRTLMMSATVLNHRAYCKSVGLEPEQVKFIQVDSDFPVENRRIHPMNVAWLNAKTLAQEETRRNIAKMVNNIMTVHKDQKGIIHTTSYQQLDFIRSNISKENQDRLIVTDPSLQREDVIEEHIKSTRPTVLISPSLYLGLDLKDDASRFQIITKVPFPDMGDRWTKAKMQASEEWYRWQTALRMVQAYGRSVRSKEDWAKTYVLDSMFENFVNKNRAMLPNWFMAAIAK